MIKSSFDRKLSEPGGVLKEFPSIWSFCRIVDRPSSGGMNWRELLLKSKEEWYHSGEFRIVRFRVYCR